MRTFRTHQRSCTALLVRSFALVAIAISSPVHAQKEEDIDANASTPNATDTVVPTAPTSSAEQYTYWLYSSSDACTGPESNLVGVRGFVALEEFAVTGDMPPTGSCATEMSCLFDEDSEQCQSLGPTRVATGYDAVTDEGDIYECDSTNFLTEEDVCELYDSDACFKSSIYPSCNTGFLSTADLKNNPNLLANPSESDQMDMEDYYYIAYYDGDGCTNTVGIRAFISEEAYTLPIVGEDVSCEDAMACLYNEDGPTCQERRSNETSGNFSYITGYNTENEAELYSCQGTLVDLSGGECVVVDPKECTQSGVFMSKCMFRIVGASFLAKNPQYLVGIIGEGDGGDNAADDDVPPSTSAGRRNMIASSLLRFSFILYLTLLNAGLTDS